MISEEVRARIRRLFYAEHWRVGTIAEQLGLHRETVRRAINVDGMVSTSEVRPSALDPHLDFLEETLKAYPRLTGTRLHEMVKARGYLGSARQVRRRVRQLGLRHKPRSEAFLRLKTLPGEQAQVDWVHLGAIPVGRGHSRSLSGLVIVLSYCRAFHVHFSFDQTLASVMRGHVEAFRYFGGVPRQLLYDNMKTVVSDRVGEAVTYHPRLLELAGHYLFQPLVCPPRKPNHKGRVERRIRDIRSSFWAGRRFGVFDEVRAQFQHWRDEVAHQRRCPENNQLTIGQALVQERPSLLALPRHDLSVDDVLTVVAKRQPYVRFQTNRYSIDPSHVGATLTLVVSQEVVRILHGQDEIGRHQRCYAKHQHIEDRAHIDKLIALKKRGRNLAGRGRLLHHIPEAEPLLVALSHRGEMLGPHVRRLLMLFDEHGRDVLIAALSSAMERNTPRAESVAYLISQQTQKVASTARLPRLNRPLVDELHVSNHRLEDYDDLSD